MNDDDVLALCETELKKLEAELYALRIRVLYCPRLDDMPVSEMRHLIGDDR